MLHRSYNQSKLTNTLIHEALKHWHTSIVESSGDFHRMKSTLTAIMPQLMQQFGEETASLAAAKTTQLRQNRRYKKLMRRCSQLNNALIKAKASKPVDVAAVRKQAYAHATRIAETYINGEYEAQGCAAQMIFDELRALSAEPAQGEKSGVTISTLQSAHIERQKEWCPNQQPDLSFRGNEMAGEVGEACNVIKKLERERQGWRGSRSTKEELASELADVIHTAILCAVTAGIDLELATVEKFNATSDKNDLRTRLPAAPTSEAVA